MQIPLLDLLLERGAAIDGVRAGDSTVRAALANNCPEAAVALVERGARVPDVIVAAGVGRLELVRQLAGNATKEQLEHALIMAARYGRPDVVEHLLERNVDVAASDGMTALHWAAGGGHLEMVKLLIQGGAPLEVKNVYGGTALDSTLWFAYNVRPEEFTRNDYPAVIDFLITAGARADLYPEMSTYISEVYRRAGRSA
ncbi:MAG: ankyrin repeat domain-containing protein [Gemmatimonadaceae bacterium]